MRGDLVRDEGVLFEVVYDGVNRRDDSDLFNPPEHVEVPVMPRLPALRSREACVEALWECCATGKLWRTERLRELSGLTAAEFELALNRLRKRGLILSVAKGLVQRVQEAA